ncbi:MAG: CHAD domain-containing protein [Elusimicrobia bacterium]|nr:CHAD domain-containing protein [Elusimicrobiota bacterium]
MKKTTALKAARRSLKRARKAALETRRDSSDHEELHRFRVALRRLIVFLRDYDELLGLPESIRSKLRKALKETGAVRDAQVERLWLEHSPFKRSGIGREIPALDKGLWRRFDKAAARLDRALEDVDIGRRTFRKASLRAARRRLRRLKRRLAGLKARPSGRALHRARISVKHLRYLLESLDELPDGMPAIAALMRLQSTLGAIHDREVLTEHFAPLVRDRERGAAAYEAVQRLRREWRTLLKRANAQRALLFQARA